MDTHPDEDLRGALRTVKAGLEEARRSLDHLQIITAHDAVEPDRSMRGRVRCPSCGCGKLLVAAEVLDRAEAFVREAMALHQPSRWSMSGAGKLQAWICTECGLMEWYVATLTDVTVDGQKRRHVLGTAGAQEAEAPAGELPDDGGRELRLMHQQETTLRRATSELLHQRLTQAGVLNRTMRHRLCCPRCRGRDLIHAAEVLDRADGMVRAAMCLTQQHWHTTEGAGQFEAWICTGCGFTEWYVPDLSQVVVDDSSVTLHRGQTPRAVARDLSPARTVQAAGATQPTNAELRQGLVTVAENVAALQQSLTALLTQATSTPPPLRRLQGCPGCGEREVMHAAMVLDRSEVGRSRMTLAQPRVLGMEGVGPMEVWVCTACGLVEWAIADLTGVEADGERLRLVQREDGSATPYR